MSEYGQLVDFLGRTGIYHPEPPARPTEPPEMTRAGDGLGCADCGEHLNGGCVTVCLECAELREQSTEAMCNRMREICVALDKAHELTRKLVSQNKVGPGTEYHLLSIHRATTLGKLFGALATISANIPETIRRKAATPPEVKV